jgi:hypothetical protein
MNTRLSERLCAVLLGAGIVLFSLAGTVRSEEGMWSPYELPGEVVGEMKTMGFEFGPEAVFNSAGTGLANAVVRLGASGSFVSPEGLILTNHHVAYSAVQRLSTADTNFIEIGFLARTRQDEVPAPGYRADVLLSSEDVTERVQAALSPEMSPLERARAAEDAEKEIVREAEEGRAVYCQVRSFLGGSMYRLETYLRLPDVRVVYVPSRSIGEYGGDIDNWMWPRHAGDFSFMRAYVGPDGKPAEYSETNVPYRPTSYLRVAREGLKDGDFALIMGYPGKTSRYLTSYGLAYLQDFDYPERVRLYTRTLDAIGRATEGDPEAIVRVASRVKFLNNSFKNNQGMLDGFNEFGLVARQIAREEAFVADLEADPDLAAEYGDLLPGFRAAYDERLVHAKADLILDFMLGRGSLLGEAMLLYKWSLEREKDDVDRDPGFMNRDIPVVRTKLRIFERGYDEKSDRAVLRMLLAEALALPSGRGIPGLDQALAKASPAGSFGNLDSFLDRLYAGTRVPVTAERLRMFDLSHAALLAERDAFIDFAGSLYEANEARLDREKEFEGTMMVLRPRWIEALAEHSSRTLYPDANGTMRLNYGIVKGYSPRDAVYYEPFTTLTGVIEKCTGTFPFDCPERLRDLAAAAGGSKYADPAVGGVPVDFLTTNDSTGGNSGSPVINARGELAGCLFDGNYEALTSDYVFIEGLTRSISVDIRYVLFVADKVDSAVNVLKELGLGTGPSAE